MNIESRLKDIRQQIAVVEQQYQRPLGTVKLLAVSKGHLNQSIRDAVAAGQKSFGENYIQEALPKIQALNELNLEWHFIGNIQANKTKDIAIHFNWVHSVSRLKIAERLNEQRLSNSPLLNVCIEVNVSEEPTKSGIAMNEVFALASAIQQMPRLKLRGLMTIPEDVSDFEQQRIPFRKLKQLLMELNARGFELDTLSMGMSHDFKAAIAEGSTLVRIGTAIFGSRT